MYLEDAVFFDHDVSQGSALLHDAADAVFGGKDDAILLVVNMPLIYLGNELI